MGNLEPLDDELARLFAADNTNYEARPSGAQHALRLVEQRVALQALAQPLVPKGDLGGELAGRLAPAMWRTKAVLAVAALSFSAGVGAGRLVRPSQDTPSTVFDAGTQEKVVEVAVVSTQVPVVPLANPLDAASPSVRPAGDASASPPQRPAREASTLTEERDLIDTARAALSRGRGDDALLAVERHAKRFPDGSLSEEREALAVQALVVAGQVNRAKERAARFHRRYPGSIFDGTVDAILAEIVRDP